MLKRLAAVICLSSTVANAASYTTLQWGLDRTASPYNVAGNIAGAWYNLGSFSAAGAWRLTPTSVGLTDYFRIDTTNPSIPVPWSGDASHINTPFYLGVVASHATDADAASVISFSSSTGYTVTPNIYWKSGMEVFATGFNGSSNLWAVNPACSLDAGETHGIGCVGVESDINISNQNYSGIPASASGPFVASFVATGGGGKYGHAGYVVNGSLPVFNYGLLITDYTAGGSSLIQSADVFSNSKAPYFIQDGGTRTYGLSLGGTYSGFAIGIPNNSAVSAVRNGGGGAYDVLYYYDTGNRFNVTPRTLFGNTIQPGSFTIATLPVCSASLNGHIAIVTNGTAYATGTYGSAVSATGAVTRQVLCTNTGGPSTYAWAYN